MGHGDRPRGWGAVVEGLALPPNVFANPHQLRGLKPASGSLYNIKTKGVVGAMIGGRRGGGGLSALLAVMGKSAANPLPSRLPPKKKKKKIPQELFPPPPLE